MCGICKHAASDGFEECPKCGKKFYRCPTCGQPWAEEPRNLAKPNAQPALCEVTNRMIDSACMSYRHNFGILPLDEQNRMRIEAKEWFRAWEKEFGHFA